MIYEYPSPDEPIRQGDIFIGLPRIDISLKEMACLNPGGDEFESVTWNDVKDNNRPLSVLLPAYPVAAIVATQDCDAYRGKDITLCEIREFSSVESKSKDTKSAKSWQRLLTQHARINQKWFYLPPDSKLGFSEKMGVDFLVTLRLFREDLVQFINLRRGRLNNVADEHFRERIGEFFRRYPYDEWYALNVEEAKCYSEERGGVALFPWQEESIADASS